MARKQWGNHTTVVTGANDGTKQISKDAWNETLDAQGMLGFSAQAVEILIATGALLITDTLVIAGAETGTADTLDILTQTNTSAKDVLIIFPTAGDTITVTHTESLITTGQIHLADHTDRILSETEPLVLIRVGNYWYEPQNPRIFLDSEFKIKDNTDLTKVLVTSLGGMTAAKTVTLTFVNPLDSTLTFPSATSTIATLALQETFTNKLFSDSTVKFANVSDAAKLVLLSLGGMTTAKTVTLTFVNPLDSTITFPSATSTLATLSLAETLDAKTLTGMVRAQNALGTALGTTGTIDLDFSTNELVTMAAMTGNVTFTASNYAAGRTKTIRIIGGASAFTFTFPAGWKFLGAAAPASLAIGKYAVLTLTSISTTEAEAVAAYSAQV